METIPYDMQNNTPILSVNPLPKNGGSANVTFYTGTSEMLRVADDGFYVRGKKLAIDDNEARAVYQALREFLIWAALVKE
jgi:hypothetical protein